MNTPQWVMQIDFHRQCFLFNNEDNNSQDPALLASFVLFGLREPSGQKLHTVHLNSHVSKPISDLRNLIQSHKIHYPTVTTGWILAPIDINDVILQVHSNIVLVSLCKRPERQ